MEIGVKVCSRCGRKLRPNSTRCASCNVNLHRRTPRLILGGLLVVLFLLFCGAIYYWASQRGLRILACGATLLMLAEPLPAIFL